MQVFMKEIENYNCYDSLFIEAKIDASKFCAPIVTS